MPALAGHENLLTSRVFSCILRVRAAPVQPGIREQGHKTKTVMDVLKAPATKAPAATRKTGLAGYKRIEIDLRKQVEGGRWPVGAMLPSRRDLARQYDVSLVTLDRAIGPLLADGTLRADDRRGTFVLKPPAPAPRQDLQNSEVGAKPGALLSGSIGIVTSFVHIHGQQYQILHELEHILSKRGFSTLSLNRIQNPEVPRELAEATEAILSEGINGLIFICLDLDRVALAEQLSRIDLRGIPAVCILAGELTLPIPHVLYDNRSGGHLAVQHLAERGWKAEAVVAPFKASWVSERIVGVYDAAETLNGPNTVQVLNGAGRTWQMSEDPRPLGYLAIHSALSAGWRPSGGIICVNDGVAIGALDALTEAGMDAGKDFGLVSFDDDPDARVYGITSLRPPTQGMAREAARLLLDHFDGNDGSLQVRLRAQVIPRASTTRREP